MVLVQKVIKMLIIGKREVKTPDGIVHRFASEEARRIKCQ